MRREKDKAEKTKQIKMKMNKEQGGETSNKQEDNMAQPNCKDVGR